MAKLAYKAIYLFFGEVPYYISSMKKKKLFRRIPELPFSLRTIRGAIGKEYVIKHYSYGAIKTKYPDMSNIVASSGHRKQRNFFKEAVEYAKAIMRDPIQKAAWLKKARKKHRLFNYLVGKGLAIAKAQAARREQDGGVIIQNCFETNATLMEWEIKEPMENIEDQKIILMTLGEVPHHPGSYLHSGRKLNEIQAIHN